MRISSQLLVAVAVAEEPEMELQIYQLRIQVIPLTEQMCLVQMEQPQQTVEQTSTVVVAEEPHLRMRPVWAMRPLEGK
jgi:hypothetical protein